MANQADAAGVRPEAGAGPRLHLQPPPTTWKPSVREPSGSLPMSMDEASDVGIPASRTTAGTHAPDAHSAPGTQSSSEAQVVLQAVVSHRNCPQLRVCPPVHDPSPSHAPRVVSEPFAQLACPHDVVAPGMAQVEAEVPSQIPRQGPLPAQAGRPP
jgi:hypothetical protein